MIRHILKKRKSPRNPSKRKIRAVVIHINSKHICTREIIKKLGRELRTSYTLITALSFIPKTSALNNLGSSQYSLRSAVILRYTSVELVIKSARIILFPHNLLCNSTYESSDLVHFRTLFIQGQLRGGDERGDDPMSNLMSPIS